MCSSESLKMKSNDITNTENLTSFLCPPGFTCAKRIAQEALEKTEAFSVRNESMVKSNGGYSTQAIRLQHIHHPKSKNSH